jgi:rubrerythrin
MGKVDSINDILEFAIEREIEANQLYMYMAKRMKTAVMSKMCEAFAQEELEHKDKLEMELIKQGKIVRQFDISAYTMEVGDPINMNYDELLMFAIKKEQTSIDFYTDLAEIVKDKESRDMLLALADEETIHKLQFAAGHNSLKQA